MERKKYIDFHTHTYYSDGIGTPELNVRIARMNGIDILAITDHDKTDGYEEARQAGERWQVKIIPGVEVSTDKCHILGLGLDIYKPEFVKFLDKSANEQREVCIKRLELLRSKGVPITLEKLVNLFPKSRLGKMNILYTMAQDKECQDYFMEHGNQILTKESYNEYLRNNQGQWVDDKMTGITNQEAINQIHNAGGLAIIAHPFYDLKDMAEMETLLRQGIDGIEVQVRGNGKNKQFVDFAHEHNLLITYGSDYHGGVFDRDVLNNRGENILSRELAEALKLDIEGTEIGYKGIKIGDTIKYIERGARKHGHPIVADRLVKVLDIKEEKLDVLGKKYYLEVLEDRLTPPDKPSKKGYKFNEWRRNDHEEYDRKMSQSPGHFADGYWYFLKDGFAI